MRMVSGFRMVRSLFCMSLSVVVTGASIASVIPENLVLSEPNDYKRKGKTYCVK